MPPSPVLNRNFTYVAIGGSAKKPGTYTVRAGQKVYINMRLRNNGDAGNCKVYFKDELTGKVVMQASKYLESGSNINAGGWYYVEKNVKLRAYAAYWDGSKWVVTDQYGDWELVIESQPPKPNPAIDKPRTYVVIGGQKKAPGTYTVKKGESIQVYATIVNQGGAGTCRVFVRDEKTGNIIADNQGKVDSNGYLGVSKTITVSSDLELKAYAAYWDGSKWVVVDEYGC